MSRYIKCTCGRERGDHADLAVAQRNSWRRSESLHETPSEYSLVVCMRPGCCGQHRTKAEFVKELPDMQKKLDY